MSIRRDSSWVEYHADTLAENVKQETADPKRFEVAAAERKAFNNWADGYYDKAIAKLDQVTSGKEAPDEQTRGWLLQLAARIAHNWGQNDRSDELQRSAFGANRNLLRPRVMPPYRPLQMPEHRAPPSRTNFRIPHATRFVATVRTGGLEAECQRQCQPVRAGLGRPRKNDWPVDRAP